MTSQQRLTLTLFVLMLLTVTGIVSYALGKNETAQTKVSNPLDVDGEYWGTYDGHPECYAEVGDTTYIRCADGYMTTS